MSFGYRPTAPVIKASKDENLFAGRSLLRAEEQKKEAQRPKANSAMQGYLAKMYGGDGAGGEAKKPKKKKAKATDASGVIRIVDQDVSGFAAVKADSRGPITRDDDEDEDDDQPTVANPEEAEALKRQLENAKNYYGAREDGRGWVVAGDEDEAGPGPGSRRRAAAASGRHDSPDASQPRWRPMQRHDSPDASPPRRKPAAAAGRHDSPDASPPRRKPAAAAGRHDSPDASPPRRKPAAVAGRYDSPDASPPRRKPAAVAGRHDSPDASPPRRKPAAAAGRHDSPDASPPRRNPAAVAGRHDSPDASPPRRKPAAAAGRHDSPDASPPRRKPAAAAGRHDSPDASPPRRKPAAAAGRHDSPDASPPRRGRHDSPDASPQRKRARSPGPPGGAGVGPPPRPPPPGAGRGGGSTGPLRMEDGTAAGLVSASALREEMDKARGEQAERRRNAEGKGAETVYRDKATGRIMSQDEFLKAKEAERSKKRKSVYDEDQTLEWRGGLAQKREVQERARAMAEEAAKPFSRTEVDGEHDASLRHQVRFGDPFANLARKKAQELAPAAITDKYNVEQLEKSGFKVPQEVPPHSWLKRGVAPPVNRYSIRPGRHWDGVDRSNGFEGQMFRMLNAKAARELEARLWSMGDM